MSQRTISPLSKLILGGVNGVLSNVSDNFDELYAAGGGPPEGTSILSTAEAGGTKFLREDGDGTCSWQTPGGGAGQLIHTYVSDETSLVATNQPLAERFFLNTHRYIILLDLTNYTQCRLIVNKQGTAANAGAVMTMKYRAAGFNTSVGNYSDIGTSAVTVATDVTNSLLSSGWVDLAEAAKADVAVCVTETGGDAVLDPQYGSVILQFK